MMYRHTLTGSLWHLVHSDDGEVVLHRQGGVIDRLTRFDFARWYERVSIPRLGKITPHRWRGKATGQEIVVSVVYKHTVRVRYIDIRRYSFDVEKADWHASFERIKE